MVRFLFCLGRKSKSSETRLTPLPQKRQALLDSGLPSKSGVFGRLPFEIRHMIYVYALGSNLLHLIREGPWRDVNHRPLPMTQPILLRCYGRTEPYRLPCLLQTCRQIYVEASPVLYSTNTLGIFGVNGLSMFRDLSRRIRKDHFDVITSICINCQVDDYVGVGTNGIVESHETGFLDNWRQTWEVLATQMVGLRDLEVQLFKIYFPPLKLSLQEDWVKPMLEVRGLRRFEFDLAQGIGSDQSTADYNEKLEWFQRELRSSACSAR